MRKSAWLVTGLVFCFLLLSATYSHSWTYTTWAWKKDYPNYAPNGMPDFDQKQAGMVNCCGPVAVANCLWWYDSMFEKNFTGTPGDGLDGFSLVIDESGGTGDDHSASNVVPLVNRLAALMGTNQAGPGTNVFAMEDGIQQYFDQQGMWNNFYEITVEKPDFYFIEQEVEKSEDVILLLGFWAWVYDDTAGLWKWVRGGGHFVTVAGVDSRYKQIALSDPWNDFAECGMNDPVNRGHPAHPGDPTDHNDAAHVSHDIYTCTNYPHHIKDQYDQDGSPGGKWVLEEYPVQAMWPDFWEQNFTSDLYYYFDSRFSEPPPATVYHAEIEYAVCISPKPVVFDFKLIQSMIKWAGVDPTHLGKSDTIVKPTKFKFFIDQGYNRANLVPDRMYLTITLDGVLNDGRGFKGIKRVQMRKPPTTVKWKYP